MSSDKKSTGLISIEEIYKAKVTISDVARNTPLRLNDFLSEEYGCQIYLKREDMQIVRSYKIRGAYNKIKRLVDENKKASIVCASAGNHAQGVAYACQLLSVKGRIYMPITTPNQKVSKVRSFGKSFIEVIMKGDNFDDAQYWAEEDARKNESTFIHPFDDDQIIAGQATIGLEILESLPKLPDYLFVPVGGGGLISGLISVFSALSPQTKIIGAEPIGAPSMKQSLESGKPEKLKHIDTFVDGAAVKIPGEIPFSICYQTKPEITLVHEGKVCACILDLYNEEAIVAEPAGVLSIGALDAYRNQIKGKTVVCILSGGNNDIMRTEEIKERALLFRGLKKYFIIRFPQRAGALKEFLNNALGPNDDISYFQYIKKSNKSMGPAIVGLELKMKKDYESLINRMNKMGIDYSPLNENPNLFEILI